MAPPTQFDGLADSARRLARAPGSPAASVASRLSQNTVDPPQAVENGSATEILFLGEELGVPEDLTNAFLAALGGDPATVTMAQLAYIMDTDVPLIFEEMRQLTFRERGQLRLLHAKAKERTIQAVPAPLMVAMAKAGPPWYPS